MLKAQPSLIPPLQDICSHFNSPRLNDPRSQSLLPETYSWDTELEVVVLSYESPFGFCLLGPLAMSASLSRV